MGVEEWLPSSTIAHLHSWIQTFITYHQHGGRLVIALGNKICVSGHMPFMIGQPFTQLYRNPLTLGALCRMDRRLQNGTGL